MEEIDFEKIIKILEIDAKAVGIPGGAAEIFIEKTIKAAKSSLKKSRYSP